MNCQRWHVPLFQSRHAHTPRTPSAYIFTQVCFEGWVFPTFSIFWYLSEWLLWIFFFDSSISVLLDCWTVVDFLFGLLGLCIFSRCWIIQNRLVFINRQKVWQILHLIKSCTRVPSTEIYSQLSMTNGWTFGRVNEILLWKSRRGEFRINKSISWSLNMFAIENDNN